MQRREGAERIVLDRFQSPDSDRWWKSANLRFFNRKNCCGSETGSATVFDEPGMFVGAETPAHDGALPGLVFASRAKPAGAAGQDKLALVPVKEIFNAGYANTSTLATELVMPPILVTTTE